MMYFFTMLNLHVNVFQHAILSYAVFLDANSYGAVVEFAHLLCEINDSVFSMYHIDQQLCFYTEYIFSNAPFKLNLNFSIGRLQCFKLVFSPTISMATGNQYVMFDTFRLTF